MNYKAMKTKSNKPNNISNYSANPEEFTTRICACCNVPVEEEGYLIFVSYLAPDGSLKFDLLDALNILATKEGVKYIFLLYGYAFDFLEKTDDSINIIHFDEVI